jgi:galactokinase/mevalonate kinase-like predicted kinase
MAITKTKIEAKLRIVNLQYKQGFQTNYNANYGGYNLTTNNGSHIVRHRMSAKELYQFLDGLYMGFYHLRDGDVFPV